MGLLTLELVGLLLAAWKAPGWVKEAGLLAMITGFLSFMTGIYHMAIAIKQAGDVPVGLFFAGLKVAMIPVIYGLCIYAASLVIRIVQKPRLL